MFCIEISVFPFDIIKTSSRDHPRAFREGEVLRHIQDFREKFCLYIFTSTPAQDRQKSASLGRLFLPNRPIG